MKYYEMHEIVYQKIKNDGQLSWDKTTTFEEMWLHGTNVALTKSLDKLGLSFKDLHILDLGTGTGTSALFCAKQGAHVTGVEVSKTAIEIARQHQQELGLAVDFMVGDILDLHLNRKFDLVIDSTVLHCIVGNTDRQKFYQTAKEHLKPDGYLFVNTMIVDGDMSSRFPKEYFHFEHDVLWSLGINEVTERKLINGKSFFAHRTLLSQEGQMTEFRANGFEIVDLKLEKNPDVDCLVGLLSPSF
jgi:2-polyprenyl-3-methyl-5-hydroxy-6-metoxy-1,4-benzoquinol methylase